MLLRVLVAAVRPEEVQLRFVLGERPAGRVARTVDVYPGVRLAQDAEGRLLGVLLADAPSLLGAALDAATVPGELVGVKEAAAITGRARSNFLRDLAARPDFPRPVAELASGRVWLLADILAYLERSRQHPPWGVDRRPAGTGRRPLPPAPAGGSPYPLRGGSRLPARVAEAGAADGYAPDAGRADRVPERRSPSAEGGRPVKLAEALQRRGQLHEHLRGLRARLARNARAPEGGRPAEEPAALLAQIEAVLAQLEALEVWIAKTSVLSTLPDGMSFSEAAARRDTLLVKREILLEAADAAEAAAGQARPEAAGERLVPAVDADALREEAEALLREHDELEARFRAGTWEADLLD